MHVVEKPSNRSKVQRSYSAMLDDSIRGFFDNSTNSNVDNSSRKHDDTMSLAGAIAGMTSDFERSMKRKSKKNSRASFLRKSTRNK